MGGPPLDVLVVGVGIAGSTLAVLLGRRGHAVTLVERDQQVRSSGNPVDVRGAAHDVVSQLGLLDRLRALSTSVRRVVFVDAAGRPRAGLPTQGHPDRAFEVARADLSATLTRAAQEVSDVRFDDTVTSITQGSAGVHVGFDRAEPARFDLVVGADGLHSTVRRMAFGPDERYITSLGLYVATVQLDPGQRPADPGTVLMHNEPGTSTALHPGTTAPGAAFIFRSTAAIDPRDRSAAAALLRATYAGTGWRDAELLEAYLAAPDTYFDQVSRVQIPRWSTGRVVLLGDAASCTSLFGEGSSNAITGAARLCRALSDRADLDAALDGYEREHRRTVAHSQRLIALLSHLLVPSTAAGLRARNLMLRRR